MGLMFDYHLGSYRRFFLLTAPDLCLWTGGGVFALGWTAIYLIMNPLPLMAPSNGIFPFFMSRYPLSPYTNGFLTSQKLWHLITKFHAAKFRRCPDVHCLGYRSSIRYRVVEVSTLTNSFKRGKLK